MAEPDMRFIGEQVARMQGDLRGVKADVALVRAEQLRLEEDLLLRFDILEKSVGQLAMTVDQLEKSVGQLGRSAENFEKSVDAQFDLLHTTMATNLEVLLTALNSKSEKTH